ncbi:hypothetical protein ACIPLR_25575 [Herbaspirillum huttiense]|uniref:hypothetical protein n=1 Tax=Herbaspirillum huttiense TaxID=863372 RepID=UPI003806EF0C
MVSSDFDFVSHDNGPSFMEGHYGVTRFSIPGVPNVSAATRLMELIAEYQGDPLFFIFLSAEVGIQEDAQVTTLEAIL